MNYSLENICDFISGNAWKSEMFSDNGIPIIRINNLNENNNDFVYWPETNYDNKYLVFENDILVSLSGTIKAYKWTGSEGLLNQRIVKISIKKEFLSSFNLNWIFYKIKSSLNQIEDRGNKSTIKNISVSRLKEIQLTNPPSLDEQNHIATILDKIESVIDKRRQSILKLDEIIKSSFSNKFDNYIRSTGGYIDIKDVITEIETGWSPICNDYSRPNEDKIAVLKQSAVSKRVFDSSENKELPPDKVIKKHCFVKKDDLLFSRKNTLDFVGATAYIFDEVKNLLMPDTIFNLRYSKEMISGVYLCFLFNDINYRKNIRELATGALVSMSNISKKKLVELKLPVPDLEIQLQFEKEVRLVYDKLKIQYKSLNNLELLLKSLTQRIFIGQSLIDIDTELEAIINVINLELPDNENNIDAIVKDMAYRQKLLDKLGTQSFTDMNQYDKAKYVAFRLLKENMDKVSQEFDNVKEKIILT